MASADRTACASLFGVTNKMTQGDNIRSLRAREGLTQQQLADLVGVTKETVCRWERGRTGVKASTLYKLTKLFDVSFDELASIEGGLANPQSGKPPKNDTTLRQDESCDVYQIARKGGGFALKQIGRSALPKSVLARHPAGFFVQMNGTGMSRCYPQGSLLLVDPVARPWNGCAVVALTDSSNMVIRRYTMRNNISVLSSHSYLAEEPDIVLDRHRLRILGVVVWFQASHDLAY